MLRRSVISLALLAATAVAACGGASDSTESSSSGTSAEAATKLSLVAYAVPKAAFDRAIPLFTRTPEGSDVAFSASYGPSGDQSRKVESGLEADIVNFSLEPDVTKLVDAGQVEESWKDDENNGIVSSSVVTLVVRKGNPKNLRDWDDIIEPGVEIVTPNPFSSGSAKWNILAPYALESDGGSDQQAGLDYVTEMLANVRSQPKSGREATELFLQGTGDVLLSYENEALLTESKGEEIEHVNPPTTLKIENPLAVLAGSEHREEAEAFKRFLYSPAGQRAWGEVGFRPVDQTVAEEFSDKFPAPEKLWTIEDLGGWDKVNAELFEPETGKIAKLYDEATN